jgi:hypothetical protein
MNRDAVVDRLIAPDHHALVQSVPAPVPWWGRSGVLSCPIARDCPTRVTHGQNAECHRRDDQAAC